MTHEMMIVGRWNDMLTGGMMFQVGGVMCKVVEGSLSSSRWQKIILIVYKMVMVVKLK